MSRPQLVRACGAVALLGLGTTAAGGIADPVATMRAMHPAALFWLALSAGALPILMNRHLTGGRWGEMTEGIARAVAAPLPIGIVAYLLMLAFGPSALFQWTRPIEQLPEVVQQKSFYLNIPFFSVRTLVVFALWLAIAGRLGVWSGERSAAKPALGAGGLVLWVLSTSVFAIDWLMSLEPRWYSDIFGLLICLGFVVPAAAAVLLLAARARAPSVACVDALSDFASLWLATILGWAFLAFSQYLIIWMGNIPDELGWYLNRSASGWRWVSSAIVLLLVVIPFAALLSGRFKRRPEALAGLALIALFGHALHAVWLVLPSFYAERLMVPWQSGGAWVGLGGLWVAWLAIQMTREPGTATAVATRRKEEAHG